MFRCGIGRIEGNAPIEKQLQLCLHGVCSGFHHHKAALGNGFQLVRRHQRTFHHLQALAGIVLPLTDRAAEYRAAAQRFGELFRRLTVGRKAAEDGILTVVSQYFCAFSAVILLQLRQRLDDGYQCDTTGATRAEQRLHVKGGHSSELITEENNAVGQAPLSFFGQLKQFFG